MKFNCYGQLIFECGSMAAPYPDDYQTWDTLTEALRSLERCGRHPFIDTEQGVTLLLWIGEPDPDDPFPCDSSHNYPDRTYELGPRGGVRRTG